MFAAVIVAQIKNKETPSKCC